MCFKQMTTLIALTLLVIGYSNVSCDIHYVSHKNCNYAPKGKIIAHPANCRQYIVCNGLRSTLGNCPKDLYFNENMLSCDKNSVKCGRKPQTKTALDVETIRPVCSSLRDHNIAHAHNCSYYYQCLGGVMRLRRCPFDLKWDWRMQHCVSATKAVCSRPY